jgi:hypothetical protein
MVLLEDRLQQVEQENRIIRQRRRGKRTRLQKGGPLTIEEASQAIDQMDVNMQVVAESSGSGGHRRSKGSRVSHCSKCGRVGHNARTCEEIIEVNRE